MATVMDGMKIPDLPDPRQIRKPASFRSMHADMEDFITEIASQNSNAEQCRKIHAQQRKTIENSEKKKDNNDQPRRKENDTPVLCPVKIHLAVRKEIMMVACMSFIKRQSHRIFSVPEGFMDDIFTQIEKQHPGDEAGEIDNTDIPDFQRKIYKSGDTGIKDKKT
ncbi:hypothetical protein LOC54_04715 [Acetobacter sp. AN02]|nr:hypothetical protein [Acetobacter sp. AN02]MDG6094421.1 hypothetical protein [Acetobacter sp. AN02]